MPHFPDRFYSLAMWISQAVGPTAPHCSADHFAAGFVMSEYHKASCHRYATGDIQLHFLSTVSPSKMGNQTIVFCIALSPEFPWSLPGSLFQSCQRVFESIINLWVSSLLCQPCAIPQDTGARTRKPQWPHNPEGMGWDHILTLHKNPIFQKRISHVFLQGSPAVTRESVYVLSDYSDTEEGPERHIKRE